MRHWSKHWSSVMGLALLVGIAACGEMGDADAEAGADGMAQADTATEEMLDDPVCEPSERMDVVGRTSPYDSTSIELGEGTAKVCYGRPSLRGRTMIGGDAVPYDTLWRTGANEPTTIHVNVPARIAGLDVEPGSYSLYTIPREDAEWTLIVNRATAQWGHESTYTDEVRAQEVGRVPVQVETLDSRVEELTIRPVEAGSAGEADDMEEQGLLLEWQNSRVHIPVALAG